MKKQEIDDLLHELDLATDEFYILSGASLVIRGIREECGDLDLCMTEEAFEKIKNRYDVKHLDGKPENLFQVTDEIETFVEPRENFTCEIVEHYPLENLERILAFKKERRIKKDESDIQGIEAYLQNLKQEVSCGAYVIEDGKVLLVQHNEGHWDFPKGHMEKDETEEETAKREVLEETGIEIEIVSEQKNEIEYKPEMNVQKKVVFFEAKKIGGNLKRQESEIQNIEWIPLEDVFEKITYAKSREAFQSFLERKKGENN